MKRRKILPRGFTIVELLIVVVVIAILASIVIIAYNGVQNRAKISSAQASVEQANKKIRLFAIDNSESYPANLAAIGITDTSTTSFQYSVDNTASPRTFCVSATVSGANYYISQAITNPTSGVCPVGPATSSVFNSTYPYSISYHNDGGGSLKLATIFYSNSSPFTIKGGRVYLPSVPAGVSLTIFYVVGFYTSSTIHSPNWSQVPSSIPNQYVTIPNSSLVTGWNQVTFPSSATINAYSAQVDGTSVWVGYYFSDGNGYVYSSSPSTPAILSLNNPHLYLAERDFEGVNRSNNNLGWSTALYGIDIITVGP